jgi:hypothetical protein
MAMAPIDGTFTNVQASNQQKQNTKPSINTNLYEEAHKLTDNHQMKQIDIVINHFQRQLSEEKNSFVEKKYIKPILENALNTLFNLRISASNIERDLKNLPDSDKKSNIIWKLNEGMKDTCKQLAKYSLQLPGSTEKFTKDPLDALKNKITEAENEKNALLEGGSDYQAKNNSSKLNDENNIHQLNIFNKLSQKLSQKYANPYHEVLIKAYGNNPSLKELYLFDKKITKILKKKNQLHRRIEPLKKAYILARLCYDGVYRAARQAGLEKEDLLTENSYSDYLVKYLRVSRSDLTAARKRIDSASQGDFCLKDIIASMNEMLSIIDNHSIATDYLEKNQQVYSNIKNFYKRIIDLDNLFQDIGKKTILLQRNIVGVHMYYLDYIENA